ncbi:MAG: glycosyltransferase family 4 protein [Bacteroidota bacterium]|nr:glycosyltransferase family 4 protein [Bacteroidota bacterium]
MKLLIITHLIPYPLSEGGKISQYALIDYLRKKCSITLLLFVHTEADDVAVLHLKKTWQDVAFEVITMRPALPPRRKRTAKTLLQAACKAVLHKSHVGYDKMFPSSHLSQSDEETRNENIIDLVDFIKPRPRENIDKINAIIEDFKPDIIQIEFVYLLDLVLCLPPHIKKIFIHHELRFMRVETEMATIENGSSNYARYLKRLCEISEIGLLKNFDAIVTMSEDDERLLLQSLPKKEIYSSPFPILDSEIKEIKRDNLIIEKLVFVGGEFHSPNKDAVEWYISSIAKMVVEKLGLTLHIIGNWSLETMEKYKNHPSIHFTGYIEDLSDYCRNSIMLVPLRIGSGIRQKILYAAAAGVPIISTTIGSEGIPENAKFCVEANTPEQFIDGIGKIANDINFTEKMVANAQIILGKYYSQQVAGQKRLDLYQSVLESESLVLPS